MEASTVRKESETLSFQTLGRFETVGSNLRYGIPEGFATVLPHLRKVSNDILNIVPIHLAGIPGYLRADSPVLCRWLQGW